tara:strand:- start:371 stop:1432 length:1062 start_codon:yes stop_codon:yes gene_type:complete
VKEILSKYKNILITGGAGFIGKNLIIKLLKDYSYNILNIDKIGYASDLYGINNNLKKLKSDCYEFLKIDLINKSETIKAINKFKPDLVFHLAAESHVDRSINNPVSFIESNILGTFNLLEALREYWSELDSRKQKSFKFVHISTDEVYGSLGNSGLFNENSQYDPRSPYSASKASSDHLVKAWHNTFHFPAVVVNCSNNFGPWQYPEKLIPLTILNALNGIDIPLYGNGENIRDWLFVEDHVEALILIASKGISGESYCIGGDNQISNKNLVLKICEELELLRPAKYKYKDLIKYVKDRPGHDFRYAIDSSKMKSSFQWKSRYDFQKSLKKTILWYIDNENWVKNLLHKNISR